MSINWPYAIGALLLAIGSLGGVGTAGWYAMKRSSVPSVTKEIVRSADVGAPANAMAWVADIRKAMGNAPADSVLAALAGGMNRDQARAKRIAELEATK